MGVKYQSGSDLEIMRGNRGVDGFVNDVRSVGSNPLHCSGVRRILYAAELQRCPDVARDGQGPFPEHGTPRSRLGECG